MNIWSFISSVGDMASPTMLGMMVSLEQLKLERVNILLLLIEMFGLNAIVLFSKSSGIVPN